MDTPIALTAISGGINRLRTKGGADKNSLFDLLNGYVTQAGTVKVREGTFRNANIATYSGAGATKGLLAYQSKLHVFSNAVVGVPNGYVLHVINHPASQQFGYVATSDNIRHGNFPAATRIGNNVNAGKVPAGFAAGFAIQALVHPDPGSAIGFANPATINGFTIAAFFQADGTSTLEPNQVYLVITGNFNLTNCTASYTVSGVAQVYPLDIVHQTTILGLGAAYTVFKLGVTTPDIFIIGGTNTTLTLTTPGTVTLAPIPIKEIHFAAPYLGGIYVAAEFDVTDQTILAQYGNTYHFWIQSSSGGDNSNTWVKNTDYQIGDVVIPSTVNGLTYVASRRYPPNPLWSANTVETVGNVVEPTTANGFQYTISSVLGTNPTTSGTEPTWPTSDGGVVKENSAVASDQTVTRVTPAANAPTPPPPTRYGGPGMAGGFTIGVGG